MSKQHFGKKVLALMLAIAMILAWFPSFSLTVSASTVNDVPYVNKNGHEQTCESCTVITSSTTTMDSGWYVVNSNVMITGSSLAVGENQTVNLILSNYSDLTVSGTNNKAGLSVPIGATLNIYTQSGGGGLLIANGEGVEPGIGGQGNITINGGYIMARGGIANSTGIRGSHITINDGNITAVCGMDGAGIGGDIVTINGGYITAYGGADNGTGIRGGHITINDGTITAGCGMEGAGIGGDIVTINGGNITADGGTGNCTGIGGYDITINGGNITANGGQIGGAGIGSRQQGNVNITGGTIKATGGQYGAGIGGGKQGDAGTINITGGTITANGNQYSAGIGSGWQGNGGTINITGGSIKATGNNGADNIGNGVDSTNSGTLTNSAGEDVFQAVVTIPGITYETEITSLTVKTDDSTTPYSFKDMKTDDDGKLYMYLPVGSTVLTVNSITLKGTITNNHDSILPQTEITLPTNPVGYSVAAESGSTSPATFDGSYCFKVNMSTGYEKSASFKVKANDTVLTEDADGVYTISNITESQTITVEGVTVTDYTIIYNLDGGTNSNNNPPSYTIVTDTITLADASKSYYTFIGWYDAESEGNKVETIANGSTGNKTLYARFTENKVTTSDYCIFPSANDNGWYNSDITITPINGYTEIWNGTEWVNSLTYSTETDDSSINFKLKKEDGTETTNYTLSGIKLDKTTPIISGVTNGSTYYTNKTLTVTDDNLDTITANGVLLTNNGTLEGNKNTTYIIVATDKAGNEMTVAITMKPTTDFLKDLTVADINLDNVNAENKKDLEALKADIDALLSDENLPNEQRSALEEQLGQITDLLEKIAEIEKTISDLNQIANSISKDTVKESDRQEISDLVANIDALIASNNLTNEQRTELLNLKADLQELIQKLDNDKDKDKPTEPSAPTNPSEPIKPSESIKPSNTTQPNDTHSNPKTGDTFKSISWLFALAIASGTGCVVFKRKRKLI